MTGNKKVEKAPRSIFPQYPQTSSPKDIDEYLAKVKALNITADEYLLELSNRVDAGTKLIELVALSAVATLYDDETQEKFIDVLCAVIERLLISGNIDSALTIESLLYESHLKRLETEEAYDRFFSKLSIVYNRFFSDSKKDKPFGVGYLFVIHTASFLAHINPLLEILRENGKEKNKSLRIAIIVLGDKPNMEFFQAVSASGVELFSCHNIKSLSQKIVQVEQIRRELGLRVVIWQCLPVWLSFASNVIRGLCWWSVKFHPGIRGLRAYIGSIGGESDFELFGNTWANFTAPVKLKNKINPMPSDWGIRRTQFGCFTREELIDNQEYWSKVLSILSMTKAVEFHYTGRRPIHLKWVSNSSELKSKIRYLGWLTSVEEKMKDYAFLLDPFPLGHGNMAREALAAKVPIVHPNVSGDGLGSVIHKLYKTYAETRQEREDHTLPEHLIPRYSNEEELQNLARNLLEDELLNREVGEAHKALLDTQTTLGSWSVFEALISKRMAP